MPDGSSSQPKHFVKIAHDITERKAREEAMRHQASHDQLTGLPNRALMLDHLRVTIAHAKRHSSDRFAVLFLDVDKFKLINDSKGHAFADKLLEKLARRLRALVREEDVVARMGGDEFAILVTDVASKRQGEALAARLREALNAPFTVEGRDVFITVSVGIALNSVNAYETPEAALQDADLAMYHAKALGSGKHALFDVVMRSQALLIRSLEAELRQALDRDELRIAYQPIVSLGSLETVGFEALVRWQHPTRGLLPPAEFIPTAINTGQIIAVDRWVLLHACRRVASWQQSRSTNELPFLAVNVSSKHFQDGDCLRYIIQVLTETGLEASRLKLEVTEDVIMETSRSVIEIMNELCRLHIDIHIDDFGTGYSSLSYLADLPVKLLKIDRSFIRQMIARPSCAGIVGTIIKLGRDLQLEATAEGIETLDELNAVRALGCAYGQGFLFSAPVDWSAAAQMLGSPVVVA